ncbi:MAG: transposase [Gemmataceae bacterium]
MSSALPAQAQGGRLLRNDRRALTGTLFVLEAGIAWTDLPAETACGWGKTCRRRLHDWQKDGSWAPVHADPLARRAGASVIDWSGAAVDSAGVLAFLGGATRSTAPPSSPRPAATTT